MIKNSNRLKSDKTVFTVALILLLAVSVFIAVLPTTMAAALPNRKTGAFAAAAPRVSGLGQQLTCNLMVWPPPQGPTLYTEAQQLAGATTLTPQQLNDLYSSSSWINLKVTFTKPDGTIDTFMPTDAALTNIGINVPGMSTQMGTLLFYYTPDQTGTWSIQCTFPGQTIPSPNGQDTVFYEASISQPTTFTVQSDKVNAGLLNGWPYSQLPTGYWDRPVNVNNREWYSISGDWLQSGYDSLGSVYNPYTTAPNSAHILWKNNHLYDGGLAGGDWGSLALGEAAFSSIIMAGKLYYNDRSGGTFSCVDLRTGQLLYRASGSVTLGQHIMPFYQTEGQTNEGEVTETLWSIGSSWKTYDPVTGALLTTYTNCPTNTRSVVFEEGNPVVYISQAWGWNTTLYMKYAGEYLIKWDMSLVKNNNWPTGIVWNVSIRQPDGLGVGDGRTNQFIIWTFRDANVVICKAHSNENIMFGYDMTTGAHLWTTIMDNMIDGSSRDYPVPNTGPLILSDVANATYHAFDVKTGKEIWETPRVGEGPWAALGRGTVIYGNTFYAGSFDGRVYAIDVANGQIKWQSDYVGDTGETVYNTWPLGYQAVAGADGKLYFATSNIYRLEPRARFQRLFCIDTTTGKFLWNVSGAMGVSAIADGYMVTTDSANGVMYTFGKGPTSTAVSIQNDVVTKGASVVIKGSVLDQSPAQAGTPAVSDESMGEWMDYLNMQDATLLNSPPTPKGVQVQLTAIDSTGKTEDLGTVMTDAKGGFATMWTPTNAGLYTVVAKFAGSESYWSSEAETSLGVTQAAVPTPTATSQSTTATTDQLQATNYYVVGSAVLVAVVVIAATVFIVRKRK